MATTQTRSWLYTYGKLFQAKIALIDYLSRGTHLGRDTQGVVKGLIDTIEKSLQKEALYTNQYEQELFEYKQHALQQQGALLTSPTSTSEHVEHAVQTSEELKDTIAKQKDILQRLKISNDPRDYVTFFNLVTREVNELNILQFLDDKTVNAIRRLFANINNKFGTTIILPDEPIQFDPIPKTPPPTKTPRMTFTQLKANIEASKQPPLPLQNASEQLIRNYGFIVEKITNYYFFSPGRPHQVGECAQTIADNTRSAAETFDRIRLELKTLLNLAFKPSGLTVDVRTEDNTPDTLFLIYLFKKDSLSLPFAPYGSTQGRTVNFPYGEAYKYAEPGRMTEHFRAVYKTLWQGLQR